MVADRSPLCNRLPVLAPSISVRSARHISLACRLAVTGVWRHLFRAAHSAVRGRPPSLPRAHVISVRARLSGKVAPAIRCALARRGMEVHGRRLGGDQEYPVLSSALDEAIEIPRYDVDLDADDEDEM